VKAKLIDFIAPTNFMQTTWDMPHDRLGKELGDKITIYGVTELMINGMPGYSPKLGKSGERDISANAAVLRANAAGKLVLGADGIEQYNFFVADANRTWPWGDERVPGLYGDYSALKGITDPDFLRGQPKHYALSSLDHPSNSPPFDLTEPLPVVLAPDSRQRFALPMCAEPGDRGLQLTVQVIVEKKDNIPGLGVSFNESWPNFSGQETEKLLFPSGPFTHIPPSCNAYNYQFHVASIVDGWNELVVFSRGNRQSNAPCRIIGIELAVQQGRGIKKGCP
jgi:hypothetical protein